ncbi:hypothetical protein [Aestuariicoccus sp. MJ-SS9]|uniref:hypothetical protein n=1 Tax=Aestuariicoccus sp. MJ-SS9 TaxID=3079855 RepID=UPI0029063187|nr:hypothetical protein [Aestuariicoccus sp. MJ-SS9]MDU8911645.1 hypothetical protein [Aestuariicoccus sp. MJ-SS9]
MRKPFSLLTAFALTVTPVTASAQAQSWLDLFDPDRIAEGLIQYGILAARTQVDLTYQALTVDMLAGRAVLTELELYPLPVWDDEGACKVSVDRVVLTSAPAGDIDNLRLRASLYGVKTHRACFPPDSWPMFAMLQLAEPSVPHATISVDYHIPSAGARVGAHVVADGLMAVDLAADFDYFWFDGSQDMEEPEPVAFLNSAVLSVENLGVWDKVSNILPPSLTDPAAAPDAVTGMLSQMLTDMNRAGAEPGDAPPPLTDAQQGFIAAAATAWGGFLAAPQRLVLETQIDPDNPQYLDFVYWEEEPAEVFNVLAPRVSLVPSAATKALPADTIRRALSAEETDLSADEKLTVGRALVTGVGAPRSVNAGIGLLVGLARDGDIAAASALSEALEPRDPRNAYGWALIAAANGAEGAMARLDRLERSLPFADILSVQAEVQGDRPHPLDPLDSVAAVKAEARARLTGTGQPRNYMIAAMWAMIAKAAGDAEGSALLEEIDQRAARAGTDATEAWAESEARASDLAMEAWIGQDLPARFGRQ